MDFDELLEIGRNPGDDGHPEDLWDQLAGAHNDSLTIRDSAYTELDGKLSASAARVTELQAHNYRLMMQLEGDKVEDPETDADNSGEPFTGNDTGVDSIWTVKEDS